MLPSAFFIPFTVWVGQKHFCRGVPVTGLNLPLPVLNILAEKVIRVISHVTVILIQQMNIALKKRFACQLFNIHWVDDIDIHIIFSAYGLINVLIM